jgi:formate dehydrogenase subunit gamma
MTMLARLLGLALLALPLLQLSPTAALAQHQAPQQAATMSAEEMQMFQELQGSLAGRVSIPDQQAATLIQPAGKEWRDFIRDTLPWVAGIFIGGMVVLLALFYLIRGRVPIEGGRSGETITRFSGIDRFAHWLSATSFIVLGLTGLNLAFGKMLLLPLIGPEAFTTVSEAGKIAHNFVSFPIVAGIILMFVIWVKDNIPSRIDVEWFLAGGGVVGHKHAHSRRFNGGQKFIFWSVIILGSAIAVTGYMLMFPFVVAGMDGMQLAQVLHAVLSMIMISIILAHIYIGSLGMEGAFEAMGSGEVDLNWAEAHHDLWAEEQRAKGQINPAGGSRHAVPAE